MRERNKVTSVGKGPSPINSLVTATQIYCPLCFSIIFRNFLSPMPAFRPLFLLPLCPQNGNLNDTTTAADSNTST
jgi:hypothetical protein